MSGVVGVLSSRTNVIASAADACMSQMLDVLPHTLTLPVVLDVAAAVDSRCVMWGGVMCSDARGVQAAAIRRAVSATDRQCVGSDQQWCAR
jgi:hypothetical protein